MPKDTNNYEFVIDGVSQSLETFLYQQNTKLLLIMIIITIIHLIYIAKFSKTLHIQEDKTINTLFKVELK